MMKLFIASAFAVTALAGVCASSAEAANARHPYNNVNRSNDKGNDTGDAQVERLNAMQLDRARGGSGGMDATMGSSGASQSMAPGSVMKPAGNAAGTQR